MTRKFQRSQPTDRSGILMFVPLFYFVPHPSGGFVLTVLGLRLAFNAIATLNVLNSIESTGKKM